MQEMCIPCITSGEYYAIMRIHVLNMLYHDANL